MAENTHCLRVYSDRISKGKPRKRFDITPVIYIFVKTVGECRQSLSAMQST